MVIKASWDLTETDGIQEVSLWLQQVWAAVLSSAPSQWREDVVITGWKRSLWTGLFSCSADLHCEQRWRSQHESLQILRGHSGGCELESKCSRLSNVVHSVTGMAHPAARQFITGDTCPMSRWNRWAGTKTDMFTGTEHMNTDLKTSDLPRWPHRNKEFLLTTTQKHHRTRLPSSEMCVITDRFFKEATYSTTTKINYLLMQKRLKCTLFLANQDRRGQLMSDQCRDEDDLFILSRQKTSSDSMSGGLHPLCEDDLY